MPAKMGGTPTSKAYYDGAMPFFVNSPVLDLVNGTAVTGHFVCPCHGYITEYHVDVFESPGTAPATVNVGTPADPDGIVDAFTVALTDSGYQEISGEGDSVIIPAGRHVTKGQTIVFSCGSEASTTGKVALTLVIDPNYVVAAS